MYFTEDGIWTMNDEDGELRLTIMATLAQNESKKTSMRVKAGQMVSFQNGVVYGTGNVLGYDKVGPEYVINEAQAKTVRKIFDMYLAGNGSQKIKKQLEKDGDLTAMGKSLWHYATISHILKNRLYCGELEYRKEYVPDYLEQKRAKNNGELDRIIVEGKHQPIVTKEEFEKVQKMIEEKRPQMEQCLKRRESTRMTSGAGSCGASADTLSQRPGGTPSQGTSPPTPTSAMTRPGRVPFRQGLRTA